MNYVFFKKYLQTHAEYKFVCRNKDIKLGFLRDMVEKAVEQISALKLKEEEIEFLKSLNLFDEEYLTFLKDFKLNKDHVKIEIKDSQLEIRISGPMIYSSPWEIYLLSSVNELYFKSLNPEMDYALGREKLQEKIKLVKEQGKDFKFMEFGTRRRHSQAWQEYVTKTLKEELPENLIGTSNVYLAMKLGIKPVGTMAHEYLQAHQSLAPQLKKFQKTALKVWKEVYKDKLLVALTDVISTDSFLKDLDQDLSKSYTGLRHDSGDPIVFGEKALAHYKQYNINTLDKTLVFSDGLDFHKAFNIFHHFKNQFQMVFGIGTNLTNDVGVKALNIVIKMVDCDHKSVAKISDEPTKAICEDEKFLKKLMKMFQVQNQENV
jgi:nicotinate phosphoribosyltransferase